MRSGWSKKPEKNGDFSGWNWPEWDNQQKKTASRIRVVAEPTTNSLLVRAKPLDMLTIRRLVTQTLDTTDVEPTSG